MANPIYNHKGEEVQYYPDEDVWGWGDYRNASFQKVKAYVDRELPKQLKPVEAYDFGYTFDYDGKIERVSVAAPSTDGKFWLTESRAGKRREKSHKKIYEVSTHNDECIARLQTLREQRAALLEKMNAIFIDELRPLTPEHLKE